MLVRHWMTADPYVARPEHTLIQAYDAMRRYRVRRLPVVDDECLVGILSLSDVYGLCGPRHLDATSEALMHATDLGVKSVRDHMTRKAITCEPDDTLEDAALLQLEHRVGALPVLHDERVVGIITESDLFRALTRLMRAGEHGERICFQIPAAQKNEIFLSVAELCAKHAVVLKSLITHPLEDGKHELVTIRVDGPRVRDLIEDFWDLEFQVMQVR